MSVAALALVAGLLVIFGGAAVSTGRAGNPGAELTLVAKTLPGTVNPGHVVTYELTASTFATSNLSHFTITAPVPNSTDPFPFLYVSSSRPDVCTAPTDPATAPASSGITCSFGAFRAGAPPIVLDLAFSVPKDTTATSAVFQALASYSGGANNDNSGRTNLVTSDPVTTTVGAGANTDSGYVLSSTGDTLSTLDSITLPNGDQLGDQQQSARADVAADVLSALFGVSGKVQDRAGLATDCGSALLAPCWGQAEDVTFLDSTGVDVALGKISTVYIRTDKTELPKGISDKTIRFWHTVPGFNDGNPFLLPLCGTGAVPETGCQKGPAKKLSDGDLVTTILAYHHGQYRP
jgi:hypothetical protein